MGGNKGKQVSVFILGSPIQYIMLYLVLRN